MFRQWSTAHYSAMCYGLLTAAGFASAIERPNVLFILSDDQRPDTIRALGNPYIETPNLDRLAQRGVVFTQAVCANPICTPSRAEILSGCSGFQNGVLDFGDRIEPHLKLWPQAMREAGYRTIYVGKWHNDGLPTQRGFDATHGLFAAGGGKWWKAQADWKGMAVTGYRGWVFQDDTGKKFPERGVGLTPDISEQFADAAIEILRHKADSPFFLQVCFTAPHDPLFFPSGYEGKYHPEEIPLPPNFLSQHPFDHGNQEGRDERLLPLPRTESLVRETLAVYYAVISHMDQQIGRMMDVLRETDQLSNTIVIFSSDHGVGVGSHGLRGKQNMYQHTINVPLIIAGPNVPRGEQRDAQLYLRDLYPTVCELTGVPIPETVRAESFAGVLAGKQREIHPTLFCYFRDKQRMVRDSRWKLIHYPSVNRWQLFDLHSDPHEVKNLAADKRHSTRVAHLRSVLRAEQQRAGDFLIAP